MTAGGDGAGGLMGVCATANETITASSNSGAVEGTTNVGGLLGNGSKKCNISASANTGTVEATAEQGVAGGLAGITVGSISGCYTTGAVNGGAAGQLAGSNTLAITGCFAYVADSGLPGLASGAGSSCYVLGAAAADADETGVAVLTAEQFKDAALPYLLDTASSPRTYIWKAGELHPELTSDPTEASYKLSYKAKGGNAPTGGSINVKVNGQEVGENGVVSAYGAGYTITVSCNEGYTVKLEDLPANAEAEETENGIVYTGTIQEEIAFLYVFYLPGSGELFEDEPEDGIYRITTADELIGLAEYVNAGNDLDGKAVLLENDIDLSGRYFEPIGTKDAPFRGSFDGQGHSVTLNIDVADDYQGLFGYVVAGTGEDTNAIANVTVRGSIKSSGEYVGGVAGYSCAAVTGCRNEAAVYGTSYVGGVVGYSLAGLSLCVNAAEVSGTSYVGGVTGYNGVSIDNCYHAGTVSGTSYIGGIAGMGYNSVANSFSYDANVTIGSTGSYENCYSLSENDSSKNGVTVLTKEAFASLEAVWLLDANGKETRTFCWAKGEEYPVFATEDSKPVYRVLTQAEYGSVEAGGSVTVGVGQQPELSAVAYGEVGTPYTIVAVQSAPELYGLILTGVPEDAVEEPAGTYSGTLDQDITVSYMFDELGDSSWLDPDKDVYEIGTAEQLIALKAAVNGGNTFAGKTVKLTADIDMSGKAFVGIGSENNPFQGTFDGQNHTVSGLSLQSEQNDRGFFSGLENATVKDLTVSGEISGLDNIGLLVGYAKGSTVLENCFVAAGSSIQGNNYVGGLVGRAAYGVSIIGCGTLASEATDDAEASYVAVTAVGTAGGIAGIVEARPDGAESRVNIKDCVSRSVVSTTGNGVAGNYGGGIVGRLESGTAVQSCENDGTASAYQYVGGIAGCLDSQVTIAECKNLGGLTTRGSSYIGGIASYAADSCVITGCVNEAAGTISRSGYLGGILGYVKGPVTLTGCENKAAISGTSSYVGGILGYAAAANAAEDLVTITGCVNSGVIKSSSSYVGGILAYSAALAQLTGCVNSGGVSGSYYIGGIAGCINTSSQNIPSKLVRCKNEGTVTGTSYAVGGVAGSVNGNYVTVEDCSNTGAVTSTSNSRVAGIVAYGLSYYCTIAGCANSGNITGYKSAHGIFYSVGDFSTVENCRNSGTITATNGDAAGLGYSMQNAMYVANCYNTGDITATGNAAGIINTVQGFLQDMGGIQDCYNTGKITGNGIVAGVLGNLPNAGYQDMKYCYNSGTIEAGASSTVAGGVFGMIGQYSYPSNCYNAGDITVAAETPTAIGGVVAQATTDNYNYLKSSHNYGTITVAGTGAAAVTGALLGGSVISQKCGNLYYKTGCVVQTDGTVVTPVDADVATAKTEGQFKKAEVAYLLDDGTNALRTYIWTQGSDYPVFASADEKAVYRVRVTAVEGGALIPEGENYGAGGSAMSFSIVPDSGYKLSGVTLIDGDNTSYILTVSDGSVSFEMPAADTVLTAAFVSGTAEDTTYTATFQSNGAEFATVNVKSGETLAAPTEKPVRDGYVFKGWYIDEQCNSAYDFNSLVTGDITLYAKWVEAASDTITVSFNLNGSDGTAPESQTIAIGGLVTRPETPTWTSDEVGFRYRFEGWYTAKAGGQLWDFDSEQPTEDMTLWAHWSKQDAFSSGTQSAPYVITTYEELKQLAENVVEGFGYGGSYFQLGADITIEDAGWGGIGYIKVLNKTQLTEMPESGTVPFNGYFDGNGYTITIDPDQNVSVFGAIGSQGVVTNLNVAGTLNADKDSERGVFGGVAGANFGLIDSCNVELTAGSGSDTYGNVSGYGGGIVGALSKGTIQNCTAKVELYKVSDAGIDNNQGACGGIVGYVMYGATMDCTVKAGSYIYNGAGYGGGGVAGTMTSNTSASGEPSMLIGCTVEQGVTVAGKGSIGGLAGWGSLISNCCTGASVYSDGTAAAFVASPQTVGEEGVVNCYYYGSFVEGAEDDDLQPSGTFTNCYYAFVDDTPAEGSKATSTRITYVTEGQLASGEVAYLLDGGSNDVHFDVWSQSTETQTPVLKADNSVWQAKCTISGEGTATLKGIAEGEEAYQIEGEEVIVNAVPSDETTTVSYDDGSSTVTSWVVQQVTVDGEDITDTLKFAIPAKDVVVQVVFAQVTEEIPAEPEEESDDPDAGYGPWFGDKQNGTGTGTSGTGTGQGTGNGNNGNEQGLSDGEGTDQNGGSGSSDNRGSGNVEVINGAPVTVTPAAQQEQVVNPAVTPADLPEQTDTLETTPDVEPQPDAAPEGGNESGEQGGEEEEVQLSFFEVVRNTLQENPLITALCLLLILVIIALAGYHRYRKSRGR